ncbi:MAG: hypothetical protein R3284_04115 [Rubricoccaceae bacterium]|nr:hypothetical protein [Rubricoccaceae bacterium]
MAIRIAMWSGPRNISTALMRSWGSREDTTVVDEPLYAFYLKETGREHPGREAILKSQPTDWQEVALQLTGPVPEGKTIYYQKHMAHHLLPEVDLDWLMDPSFRHAFLIREPRAMLTSLARVVTDPRIEDTGLPQQVELFEKIRDNSGKIPPVIASRDVLQNPEAMLGTLCSALEVPFDPSMLFWKAGPRETDGVWAEHWYANVEESTTFGPPRDEFPQVSSALEPVLEVCLEHYRFLHRHRLIVG